MAESMQAVVFEGGGRWGLERVPVPRRAAEDDVLLRVDRAGICGTDLHILADPPGHPANAGSILGHEYVATVAEAGPAADHLKPGDRVVIDPNLTCGRCHYCRRGLTNACQNMTTLGIFRHGGLAEFNVAPAKALHKISREVPPEKAALAEPLSCVYHAFEKAGVMLGESAAILGAGPIGLLFLLLFKQAGAKPVFVVEKQPFRRQIAEQCGADAVFDPGRENFTEAIRSATGVGADVVVDAVGTLLPESLRLVRNSGRVIPFGMNQVSSATVHPFDITRREITIFGSFIQRTAFPKVVGLLEAGALPFERLITHQFEISEFGRALQLLGSGQAIKAILRP